MLDFYFIRHAESEMNENKHLIGGRSNHTPLSAEGERQAILLGERFSRQGIFFDSVYSSPAVRTISTAVPVCRSIGYPLNEILYSESLLELDQGRWEGLERDKIYTASLVDEINKDNWNFTPPGGESQKNVEERMIKWVEDTFFTGEFQDVNYRGAIFGHGFAIKCMLRGILNFDSPMTYKTHLGNTSITRLTYGDNGWNLHSLNDVAHLS